MIPNSRSTCEVWTPKATFSPQPPPGAGLDSSGSVFDAFAVWGLPQLRGPGSPWSSTARRAHRSPGRTPALPCQPPALGLRDSERSAGFGPTGPPAPHLLRDQLVLLAGHHRSDSDRSLVSALPAGDGWRWRRLCVSGENGSGSHPPSRLSSGNRGGLSSGLRHQRADTDPGRRRRRPSPGPRQSMEKWRLPLSREFGAVGAQPGAWRLRCAGGRRELGNLLTSFSALGYATLVEGQCKHFFITGSPVLPSSGSLCWQMEGPGPRVMDGLQFKVPFLTRESDSSSSQARVLQPWSGTFDLLLVDTRLVEKSPFCS